MSVPPPSHEKRRSSSRTPGGRSDGFSRDEFEQWVEDLLEPLKDKVKEFDSSLTRLENFFLSKNPYDPEERKKGFLGQFDRLVATSDGLVVAVGALEQTIEATRKDVQALRERVIEMESAPPAQKAEAAFDATERWKKWAKIVGAGLAAFLVSLWGYLKVT